MATRKASDSNLSGKKYNDASAGGTKIADLPDTPTIGSASNATSSTIDIAFTPAGTGGLVTTYRALSTPGSIEGTSATSPITVTSLTPLTSYAFQVRAENSSGNSAYSQASSALSTTAVQVTGSYDALSVYTVPSGGVSSVTFAGIPQSGYQHLQIRGINQTNRGTYNTSDLYMTFNQDSGNNYAWHQIFSNASANGTVSAGAVTSTSSIKGIASTGSPATTAFAGLIIDILDYTNTNKYKTVRMLTGADTNGLVSGYCGVIEFSSGLWQSTSAINTITFYPLYGSSITQYSQFALYGIRG